MTEYNPEKKMKEYDQLIEKFGLEKALEIMSSTGDLYEGDVVADKKNKLILDDETMEKIASHLRAPNKIEVAIASHDIDWIKNDTQFDIDEDQVIPQPTITPLLHKMRF